MPPPVGERTSRGMFEDSQPLPRSSGSGVVLSHYALEA